MVYHNRLPNVVIVVRSKHAGMATHTYDADNRLTATTAMVTMEMIVLIRNSGANVLKKNQRMLAGKFALLDQLARHSSHVIHHHVDRLQHHVHRQLQGHRKLGDRQVCLQCLRHRQRRKLA